MKILYVIHDNKKGGAAISCLDMLAQVMKSNEVFVITPHKEGYLPQQLDRMGVRHMNAHYFWWLVERPASPVMQFMKKMLYFFLVRMNRLEAGRISVLLSKEKFDLIHSNSSVIDFGAILAKKMNIPHIWHIRELARELNYLPVKKEQKIYEYMRNHAAVMIAISKAVAEKMRELTGFDNIAMVYNGIEGSNMIEKKEFPKENEPIRFLITGNIYREKGQLTALRAARELVLQGETAFHLFVAGRGEAEDLRQFVMAADLTAYITFCGQIDDMKKLRAKTDVEIVGTKWEAFGRVTVEAMRASNPVIGTNAGGTKELIADGQNGFLFEFGDHQALAEYMKRFIHDPKLIEKMGKQAYQSVSGKFTSQQNAAEILEIYGRTVKSGY